MLLLKLWKSHAGKTMASSPTAYMFQRHVLCAIYHVQMKLDFLAKG